MVIREVEKRPLGKTGIEVSVLGLGTVKIGRNEGVKYTQSFHLPSDKQVAALLIKARELGINLIDTAPAYGTSESRLGKSLPGDRSSWILSTKVGETFVDGKSVFDFTPEGVHKSVTASLKNLQTDYLDIVLIHSDGNDIALLTSTGTLDVLLDLKKKGLIRAVGISNKTVAGSQRALERCDVIMATVNKSYRDELGVIAEAQKCGLGVLVKKAFSSGHGQTDDLSFVANQPGVSCVVVGTINPDHLQNNSDSLNLR